jgi:serine/threonine-protein kinase
MVVRSLTPSSVSLDERNTPKLADFRPAGKLPTSSIIQSYTPFMAPEELEGLSTVATDVYQVGALLYAMLTGSPPVSGTSAVEVVRNVLEARPEPPRKVNPRLGRGLEAVCLKCLEKQPVARCSVEELVSKLKSLEESLE